MFPYKLMYSGLARKIDGTETLIDALLKGIPVKEIVDRREAQSKKVDQQIQSPNQTSPPISGPRVVRPGAGNTCPPGYTYAIGYCVRDSDYYGCAPGEYWDGQKCSLPPTSCPEGQVFDPVSGKCVSRCGANEKWDGQKCVPLTGSNPPGPPTGSNPTPTCPPGYYWTGSECQPKTGPPTGSNPPKDPDPPKDPPDTGANPPDTGTNPPGDQTGSNPMTERIRHLLRGNHF